MNPRIYLTVTITAVLITVVACQTPTTDSNDTTTVGSTSSNAQTTKNDGIVPSISKAQTSISTGKPKTTTPKPVKCYIGSCDDYGACFNASTITKSTTCKSGNCAVNETKINQTNSSYKLSCETKEVCDSITDTGTGACCDTDSCQPDLKTAQSKFKAKSGGSKGGCGNLRFNMNILVCVVFILFKNMYRCI